MVVAVTVAALAFGSCRANPSRKSVVLIVVDTLGANHLGAYGYQRPTSPNLDAWAASGRLFERAFATSPWTLPSFGSIYTGRFPSRHGTGVMVETRRGRRKPGGMHTRVRTLAEILSESGYATGAIVNNPFLAPEFGVARGFASYDYVPGSATNIRRADVVVDRALAWIDRLRGEPYFLLVHFFDPHLNYDAPKPFRGRFSREYRSKLTIPVHGIGAIRSGRLALADSDRHFIGAAYDEEIAFVDQQLGRLREGLTARGVLRRGLVVLTSDHGEELFEHGGFEHGHAMWQELLHVPMVFWGDGVLPGREMAPVSLVDLAPTILEAAGSAPHQPLEGLSLWANLTAGAPVPARTLYAEGTLYGAEQKAAIRWPHKVVIDMQRTAPRLFDLDLDPHETSDAAASRPKLAAQLVADLAAKLQAARRAALIPAPLKAETREKLRALGYLK
ncbi:MAG: sulfatase [Acidobacteriota bacterium]